MPSQDAIDLLLKLTLALITLGLGFSLGKDNLLHALKQPRIILIGLLCQMILLPILTYSICILFNLSDTYTLGIVIISFCPGGSTANLVSFMLKANVGLSICLSFFNGFLCLFSIPLFLIITKYVIGVNSFNFEVPFYEILKDLFILIIIPTILGVFLNQRFKGFVNVVKSVLKYSLPLLLALVFGFKFFSSSSQGGLDISLNDMKHLFIPLFAMNFLSMLLGYFFSKMNKLSANDATTIAIETGLQNTALALLIASTISSLEIQKPAVIYASFSLLTTFFFGWFIKKGLVHKNKTF